MLVLDSRGRTRLLCHRGQLNPVVADKPYWGKPDVQHFREGDGNVGIIRSPVRAIALPDLCTGGDRLTD
jgi:hypothetical protein